jgi:transcriptional regulator with XRE-family HTH domain
MQQHLSHYRIAASDTVEYGFGAMPLTINIRELRKARGLTLRQLAEMVGVSVTHVSEIERGVKNLNNHLMVRFAKALGVTPAELIAGDEERSLRHLESMMADLSPEDRERVLAFATALLRTRDGQQKP